MRLQMGVEYALILAELSRASLHKNASVLRQIGLIGDGKHIARHLFHQQEGNPVERLARRRRWRRRRISRGHILGPALLFGGNIEAVMQPRDAVLRLDPSLAYQMYYQTRQRRLIEIKSLRRLGPWAPNPIYWRITQKRHCQEFEKNGVWGQWPQPPEAVLIICRNFPPVEIQEFWFNP